MMAKVHFTPRAAARLTLAALLLIAALAAPILAASLQPLIFGGLGLASGISHLVPASNHAPQASTTLYPAGRGVLLVTRGANGRQVMRWRPL